MGLFSKSRHRIDPETVTREEAARTRKEEAQRIDNQNCLTLRSITIYPGSKSDYENQFGYECFVIDTGRSDKGIKIATFEEHPLDWQYGGRAPTLRQVLVNGGIVALVNATPTTFERIGDDLAYYGLPIGTKKKE